MNKLVVRNNWTKAEVAELYHSPLLDLIYKAATIHRHYHDAQEVQVCKLLSIKTGGCPEDCAYCPQAARYDTGVDTEPLLPYEQVLKSAIEAQAAGATRFCMGAAWREVRDNKHFDRVVGMVQSINAMGMEVCCTLGMLTESQAQRLKDAGLYAYNHNLDTSREFYDSIISTRTYDDRLQTLDNVRNAGIKVCCGGIIGMGEQPADRVALLHTLATLPTHPESVPINALVRIEGTPLQHNEPVEIWDMIRAIATARILMPNAMVRLSAGRNEMSMAEQTLCFLAGANSIFAGDKLLTTPNPDFDRDAQLFQLLGIKPRQAFKEEVGTSIK